MLQAGRPLGGRKMVMRDRLIEAAILQGFVPYTWTDGQATFHGDGGGGDGGGGDGFERFTATLTHVAASLGCAIGNIFYMQLGGLSLNLSDGMILGMLRQGKLKLPAGAIFRPIAPHHHAADAARAVREGVTSPPIWGCTRFQTASEVARTVVAAAA